MSNQDNPKTPFHSFSEAARDASVSATAYRRKEMQRDVKFLLKLSIAIAVSSIICEYCDWPGPKYRGTLLWLSGIASMAAWVFWAVLHLIKDFVDSEGVPRLSGGAGGEGLWQLVIILLFSS